MQIVLGCELLGYLKQRPVLYTNSNIISTQYMFLDDISPHSVTSIMGTVLGYYDLQIGCLF
jgi:hypothetical protein